MYSSARILCNAGNALQAYRLLDDLSIGSLRGERSPGKYGPVRMGAEFEWVAPQRAASRRAGPSSPPQHGDRWSGSFRPYLVAMDQRNVVSKKNAAHLKLHVEEPAADHAAGRSADDLSRLCAAVRDLSGWSLEFAQERLPAADSPTGGTTRECRLGFRLQRCRTEDAAEPVERHKVQRLAEALAEMVSELHQTRDAIWRREADLAAGVPVAPHDNEQQHLAVRLEAALKGGAQAVGCQAAALYLLDDATTELKLRACWGLPKQRLLALPRPLRGAVADLEALVGHAVVLEDTSLLPQWRVPEPYDSAVCVPVSSPTEPLGTLWMFCDHPRDFSAEQTNLVEIIAGRVASELQREMLLRECLQSKHIERHLGRAIQWQNDRLPSIPPLLEDWAVSGWTRPADALRTGFFDWFVPPDDRLAVAAGNAEGSLMEAALTAASLHGAIRPMRATRTLRWK